MSEIDQVFDALDADDTGLLTSERLKAYHCDEHMCELSLMQVEAAMDRVCENESGCSRNEFVMVLKEIERRCKIAQSLRWDFALLDTDNRGAISMEKLKFLFKAIRNSMYSTAEFDAFAASRTLAVDHVAFEEIEVLLCSFPDTGFTPDELL